MPELASPAAHAGFQYANPRHQADTAAAGMWLFLTTEVLFFGGLVFAWLVCRYGHPAGFRLAAGHTNLLIGSLNTAVLVTSSFVYCVGLAGAREGRNRPMLLAALATITLGLAFLVLKGIEWKLDLDEHLFPGPDFGLAGPDRGGAQLFWSIYWLGTVLHGVHMLVGIVLVAIVAWQARRARFTRAHHTTPKVVGLYWSFVDMVWITLYPLIYVVART